VAGVIDAFPLIEARDRTEWRAWLRRHHRAAPGIWLVYHKKASDTPTVTYDEAVREALCYGWIDSLVRALDADRYRQLFTPRRPGSTWSPSNKRRVAQLIADRRMTKAGLAKIESAQADGSWQSLDAVETLTIPAELRRALAAEGDALRHFRGYAASLRKAMLYWLSSAKRPATRERRLAKLVAYAAAHTTGREFRPQAQP
jgi:uncharacterized protein YdeI (YjbR/CyaY-like superfamily)